MRIAVCISGQMRTWKTAAKNQMWFWNTSGQDVDYFIHTWDYSQDRTGAQQEYIERHISEDEYNEYIDTYKPVMHSIDSYRQEDMYGNDHWLSLFYSYVKCLLMKKEYEEKNQFEYDVVIKSRPDLVFNPKVTLRWPPLKNNQIHTTHGGPMPMEFNMQNFNDIVFLGNSYTMDLTMNIFNYRKYFIHPDSNNIKNIHPLGPGTLLNEYFKDFGLTPFYDLPFFETIVKMGHPEDVDLFDKEDFNRMEHYFRQWYHQ